MVLVMSIDHVITRIRAFVADRRWNPSQIARETGVPRSTVRRIDSAEWNPTAETIRQIERVIPEDYHLPFPGHDAEIPVEVFVE
jgi:transcriptional regulator with XRE-family HTH domain